MRRHARQIGEVMWAWNLLQSGFFHVFRRVVAPDNHPLALALRNSLQSDKAQREMAVNAAKVVLPPSSRILANLKWAHGRANALSEFRNDAAHVVISMGINPRTMTFYLVPDANTTRPAALERLLQRPVASYWRQARGDMFALGVYLAMHADHLMDTRWKLPPRPRLAAVSAGAPLRRRRPPGGQARPPRSA